MWKERIFTVDVLFLTKKARKMSFGVIGIVFKKIIYYDAHTIMSCLTDCKNKNHHVRSEVWKEKKRK